MASSSSSGIRAGYVLVKFKEVRSQTVLNQLNAAFGAKFVATIARIGVTHLQAPARERARSPSEPAQATGRAVC
jgi:hypothetical protein